MIRKLELSDYEEAKKLVYQVQTLHIAGLLMATKNSNLSSYYEIKNNIFY